MSGRVDGLSEGQLSDVLALARLVAPARIKEARALDLGEAGSESVPESAIVKLSRPYPCSSDGLDLYTTRFAMRWWGADKSQAGRGVLRENSQKDDSRERRASFVEKSASGQKAGEGGGDHGGRSLDSPEANRALNEKRERRDPEEKLRRLSGPAAREHWD